MSILGKRPSDFSPIRSPPKIQRVPFDQCFQQAMEQISKEDPELLVLAKQVFTPEEYKVTEQLIANSGLKDQKTIEQLQAELDEKDFQLWIEADKRFKITHGPELKQLEDPKLAGPVAGHALVMTDPQFHAYLYSVYIRLRHGVNMDPKICSNIVNLISSLNAKNSGVNLHCIEAAVRILCSSHLWDPFFFECTEESYQSYLKLWNFDSLPTFLFAFSICIKLYEDDNLKITEPNTVDLTTQTTGELFYRCSLRIEEYDVVQMEIDMMLIAINLQTRGILFNISHVETDSFTYLLGPAIAILKEYVPDLDNLRDNHFPSPVLRSKLLLFYDEIKKEEKEIKYDCPMGTEIVFSNMTKNRNTLAELNIGTNVLFMHLYGIRCYDLINQLEAENPLDSPAVLKEKYQRVFPTMIELLHANPKKKLTDKYRVKLFDDAKKQLKYI